MTSVVLAFTFLVYLGGDQTTETIGVSGDAEKEYKSMIDLQE
jgi:hypothetical protein